MSTITQYVYHYNVLNKLKGFSHSGLFICNKSIDSDLKYKILKINLAKKHSIAEGDIEIKSFSFLHTDTLESKDTQESSVIPDNPLEFVCKMYDRDIYINNNLELFYLHYPIPDGNNPFCKIDMTLRDFIMLGYTYQIESQVYTSKHSSDELRIHVINALVKLNKGSVSW